MKIIAFVSIFLFCFSLEASSNPKELLKYKVDPSNLSFTKDGIYDLSKGIPFELMSLKFQNGEYIGEVDASIFEDIFGVWWCYNCRNYNSKFDTCCAYCGASK